MRFVFLYTQGVIRVRKRVTLMVVAVTAIFGICWGTASIVYILHYITSYNIGFVPISCANVMILFNSAVNPFIYAFKSTIQGESKGNDILQLFRTTQGASYPGSWRLRAFQEHNPPGPPDSQYRTVFQESGSVVFSKSESYTSVFISTREYWVLAFKKLLTEG